MEEYDFVEENLNKDILDDIDDIFNVFLNDDNIFLYSKPILNKPLPIISDICFPKHTNVNTDQGKIMIENIDIKLHTINNKKIKAITQTISPDNYLVCFEKHSINYNYPSRQTIMSKNHKILYNGELMKAQTFLKKNKTNIYKIKYNGEILYNVLMENYTTIKVNNLICETLDPLSKIARIYTKFDNYKIKVKQPKPTKKLYIKF